MDAVVSKYYGETIRHEDSIIDLGAVADATLFSLREELEQNLATPGYTYYYVDQARWSDEQDLELVEWEIYYRFRHAESFDEDIADAYHCGLGCCGD